jgi:putative oxidoreductase
LGSRALGKSDTAAEPAPNPRCQAQKRNAMQVAALNDAALLAARLLLAALFVIQGYDKIGNYSNAVAYMQRFGVPHQLLPVVIAGELVGGLLIVVGWQTRRAALALAGFCILAAVFFHLDFGSRNETISFLKNLAIAGGFLALLVSGPGAWSIDGRQEN